MENNKWRIEKNYLIFKLSDNFEYDIPIEDLNRKGFAHWFFHLSFKAWFRDEIQDDFIKKCKEIELIRW